MSSAQEIEIDQEIKREIGIRSSRARAGVRRSNGRLKGDQMVLESLPRLNSL